MATAFAHSAATQTICVLALYLGSHHSLKVITPFAPQFSIFDPTNLITRSNG